MVFVRRVLLEPHFQQPHELNHFCSSESGVVSSEFNYDRKICLMLLKCLYNVTAFRLEIQFWRCFSGEAFCLEISNVSVGFLLRIKKKKLNQSGDVENNLV